MTTQPQQRSPRGPIAWMARNPVAANLLMFVIIAGGLLGLSRVKEEVFPEFELDLVTVQVAYPGASPEEVEQGIVLAVEEAVRGIDGVKRVTATAAEGAALVSAELLIDADPDAVLADVKSAVDRVRSFPEEAERPVVSSATLRREVVSLIIHGEQELKTLHRLAERARAELLQRPDVTQVEIEGVPSLELSVEIPQQRLEAYGLDLQEVARQIRAASVELPGGGLKTSAGELLVRVSERRSAGHEFEEIVLRGTAAGAEVRLGDLATVRDTFEDTGQASYFNGEPAVRLTAYRVGSETPTTVAAAVRAYADELRAELPPSIGVAVWADDSEVLEARKGLLVSNAGIGLLLVFAILALVLNLRLALWVGVGIPISFLGAFFLMPGLDLSLNMVTLFAFIVTLGLVVDDAIIVGENIYEKMKAGLPPLPAAIAGAREMAVPVAFSVLTTMAAFAPMLFVPGVSGKIYFLIPAVVIAVLLFSLVESFFILPAHLAHGGARRLPSWLAVVGRLQDAVACGLHRLAELVLRPVLELTLRQRYAALALALALLTVSVGAVGSGAVPFNFFPVIEGDVVRASARLPYGSPIERTAQVQRALEQSARAAADESGGAAVVRGLFSRLAETPAGPQGAGEVGSHLVSIEVNLVPVEQRDVTAEQFAAAWRSRTPRLAGVESLSFNGSSGPGAGAAVDVQLSHPDTEVLASASRELTEVLSGYRALTNVDNASAQGKPQLDFTLKPEASALGLSADAVARQLRASFFGAEALREQRDRNEIKVMVRLPEAERRSEYDLETLLVRTPAGGHVPIGEVASFQRGQAPTEIKREAGRRVVNVTADLAIGAASPREVLGSLEREVLPALQERFPGLQSAFVGQQREQGESFAALGQNYLLALFVIFALLAIPFRSYVQPVIIMAAIPFGFVGAVAGHVVMGYGLSLISIFGIVALSGVVVNDSLVLIAAANEARQRGQSARDAIITAALRRLRPILLTSHTTFLGLAPMIFETSTQARFLIPMAISLGFGVLFATFIVLLLVPALYLMVEDVRALGLRLRRRRQDRASAAAPSPAR